MYADNIAYAYKFVPQANRALRPFNIYLNTRQRSRFPFLPSLSFSSPRPRPSTAIPSPTATFSSAPLSRRTSSSSSHSSHSSSGARSLKRSPSPELPPSPSAVHRTLPSPTRTATSQGIPLAPIPPAQNPRGELIFSSRVNSTFREGYERFRGEWEKKRNLQMGTNGSGGSWWRWGRKSSPSTVTGGGEKESIGGEKEERGRRLSTSSTASLPSSSRKSSPFRLINARNSRRSSLSASPSPSPPVTRSNSPDVEEREGGTGREGRLRAESISSLLNRTVEVEEAQGEKC